jgi:hypothetical protein
MGTKQEVIAELFKRCKAKGTWEFDNDLVRQVAASKGFANLFDATKIDHSALLPPELRREDYFFVHLGAGGKHRFVKGISIGFHTFEKILDSEVIDWKYRQSILNELDTSESNILSVASNQRVIHDFLYNDIVASPKVYNARRTKRSIEYRIGTQRIRATNLQMEIDLTMELDGVVTVFEGKNGTPEDFAVYQLFHPFKYYKSIISELGLAIRMVTGCYILRERRQDRSVLRLYNYTFDDEDDMGSIRLLKKSQYNLIKR